MRRPKWTYLPYGNNDQNTAQMSDIDVDIFCLTSTECMAMSAVDKKEITSIDTDAQFRPLVLQCQPHIHVVTHYRDSGDRVTPGIPPYYVQRSLRRVDERAEIGRPLGLRPTNCPRRRINQQLVNSIGSRRQRETTVFKDIQKNS